MDRFSLLLLEPNEIYFTDVAVTLIRDQNKAANAEGNFSRGRLKICSKSVVYVPQADPGQSNLEPLLKFPLSDCTDIVGKLTGFSNFLTFESKVMVRRHILNLYEANFAVCVKVNFFHI